MKNLLRLTLLLLAFLSATVSFAQVGLTASGGTGTGTFTTLKAAFDAINLGTHQGNIVITITGTSTETLTATLNASGSGGASYSAILIKPSEATFSTARLSLVSKSVTMTGRRPPTEVLMMVDPLRSLATTSSAILFPL